MVQFEIHYVTVQVCCHQGSKTIVTEKTEKSRGSLPMSFVSHSCRSREVRNSVLGQQLRAWTADDTSELSTVRFEGE